MQNAKNNLAKIVKKARLEKKLTQEKLAERIDVRPRTILQIENGRGNPQVDVLFPLVRALDIEPDEVFYYDQREPSTALEQLILELKNLSPSKLEIVIYALHMLLELLENGI